MKETIPLKIKPYLEEIADRLSANHASVMIGAGFSKNARKGESMKKLSPSWHELGDCFYRKVYGKSPNDSDRCYLDVLKLAEEVEATYGRSTLEKLLKSEIPDKELQPSELHTALLNLPWTDVFTTNYDTLLERAATTVLDRRYETIVNKKDLVWSQKPRIIKLHGTFPSDRPFIITEEDYRKYPKDFAPFVNTVQQSLLENTLCLLGFSGNDPNFTKWIGWIRDNLGKENSPKIFLIGFLTLSAGQIKLMEERNIVPVDLSCWRDDTDSHYDVLMAFVRFLSEAIRTKGQKLSWAKTSRYNHSLDINNELLPQYESLISSWRQERLDYPNWLILPRDQRKILREATESSYTLIYHLGKVSAPTNLRFLFEFNWRLEKYLFPIYNEWTEYYEQVLDKYNPFSNISSEKTDTLTPNNKDGKKIKEWEELSLYWIELKLSLLRFYREEGFNDKWTSLSLEFESIYKHLSSVHKARYHYERCLFFQFQFDIDLLRKELEEWKSDISIPYWEAKRAMILAELGDLNDAERILEASLREIRSQLNFYTTITDYLLVSQEAYLLQLLKYVNLANRKVFTKEPIHKYEEYSYRWNKLLQYKCDPWGELQLFEANIIEGDSSKYNSEEITYGFNIGTYNRTRKLYSYNKAAQEAYMFLRYIEETGLALKISGVTFGKEVAPKAIEALSGYSSIWAYSTLIRTGEKKIIDSIFDRKSLSLMTRGYVEAIAKNYLVILEKYAPGYGSCRNKNDVFAISLNTMIPEILSRLCFKCSNEMRLAMFDVAKKIYIADNHEAAGDGMRKLLEKIVESFTPEEQWDTILQQIVEFPIVINPYDRNADVFTALRIDNDTKKNNRVSVKAHVVARLLAESLDDSKRSIAITRLMRLYQYGLLNKGQTKLFAKNLWSRVDEKGFPKDTTYYYSTWLNYPHPSDVDPEQLLRSYINTEPFNIENRREGNGVGFNDGNLPLPINIANTGKGSNVKIYTWSRDEINHLIPKLKEWWDEDKNYLKDKEIHFISSIAGEFKKRFKHLIDIFQYIINPNIALVDKANISLIETIVYDLRNYDFPDLQLKASLLALFPAIEKELGEQIVENLCSKNEELIYDAINASIMLNKDEGHYDTTDIVCVIGDNILCRTDVALSWFLDGISVILKDRPTAFSENILRKLEIGITALLTENIIINADTQEVVHNKLSIRTSITRLVPILISYFVTHRKEVPKYLSEWEKQLTDENEFVDITNMLLENRVIIS